MEFADHGRQHMASLKIIIVMRPIKIGGHTADEIISILPLKKFTHFQPGNFGNGIGFIGSFQRPGKQRILRNRLGSQLGINTGAS